MAIRTLLTLPAGKQVLLVSEDLPSLLAYSRDGRCEGYDGIGLRSS
ncbi:MAG TPA: hypothetical protein VFX35_01905 [Solirubrobacterales bacterium]|nr:hypothetical protein [Solirubrobacterales bacterium]